MLKKDLIRENAKLISQNDQLQAQVIRLTDVIASMEISREDFKAHVVCANCGVVLEVQDFIEV